MLYPSMSDLLKKVNNRYMLVNLTAKRARDIAAAAEENQIPLSEKPVKLALNDIMAGRVVLRQEDEEPQTPAGSEEAESPRAEEESKEAES